MSGVIDANVEKQILTGLIVSTEFCKRIIPKMKSNVHYIKISFAKEVAKWCTEYFEKYDEAPFKQIQHIYQEKKKYGKLSQDDGELINEFLYGLSKEYGEEIKNDRQFSVEATLDTAMDYFNSLNIDKLRRQIERDLKSGKIDKAENSIKSYESLSLTNNDEIFSAVLTAKEYQGKEVSKAKWLIDNVIPLGLTVIGGKGKSGKSFFLLNVAIDLSLGRKAFGAIPIDPCRVLYLALESTDNEIQDRLDDILKGEKYPDKLHIVTEWERMDKGGFEKLEKWMEQYPDTGVIIIDIWARFKKPQSKHGTTYEMDYQEMSPLHEFTREHENSLIISHHTRKTRADNVFDELLGTVGMQAVVNNMIVLEKPCEETRTYKIRGRGIADDKGAFDTKDFRWLLSEVNISEYHKQGRERKAILKELSELFTLIRQPVKREMLVNQLKKKLTGKGIDVLIGKLLQNGLIERPAYGFYAPKGYMQGMREEDELQRKIDAMLDMNV